MCIESYTKNIEKGHRTHLGHFFVFVFPKHYGTYKSALHWQRWKIYWFLVCRWKDDESNQCLSIRSDKAFHIHVELYDENLIYLLNNHQINLPGTFLTWENNWTERERYLFLVHYWDHKVLIQQNGISVMGSYKQNEIQEIKTGQKRTIHKDND